MPGQQSNVANVSAEIPQLTDNANIVYAFEKYHANIANYVGESATGLKTQIDTKQNANLGSVNANKVVITDSNGNITASSTIDVTELGSLNDIASGIQAQLDSKANNSGQVFSGNVTVPNLISNAAVNAVTVNATTLIGNGGNITSINGANVSVVPNSTNTATVNTTGNITNSTFYPTFVSANNSSATPSTVYTTSGISINPSTNTLTVTNQSVTSNITVGSNVTVGSDIFISNTYAQKIIDVGSTYDSTNNTYTLDFAQGSYFSNITLQKLIGTWSLIGSGNSISSNASSTTVTLSTAASKGDLMFIVIASDGATTPGISSPTGWTSIQIASAGGSTVNSAIYYKLATTSTSTITASLLSGTANLIAVAGVFRNSAIYSLRNSGAYARDIVLEQSAYKVDTGNSTVTGPSMTNSYDGDLSILSYYVGDGSYSVTLPTGYAAVVRAPNTTPPVGAGFAYLLSTVAGTAVPTAWGAASVGSGAEQATYAVEFSGFINPIMIVNNPTTLSSTDYKAASYIVDVVNDTTTAGGSGVPNTAYNLSWSGATIKWPYGSSLKPGTSSSYPNSMYIFQTKDGGTSFRGARVQGYA